MNPPSRQSSSGAPVGQSEARKRPSRSLRLLWIPILFAAVGAVVYDPRSIGAGVGALTGIILLILLAMRADRIKSPSSILGLFSEPILGQVPVVPEVRGELTPRLLQHADPRVKYAEAFRSLRSSLLFMGYDGTARSLLVCGTAEGEGASVVAGNLAVTMAEAGTKTLLIDAASAGGSLGSMFRVDGRHGLANVLSGQATWDSAIQQTAYPNLRVLTAGNPDPSSVPQSSAIAAIIAEALGNHDLVIIDAAPVGSSDLTSKLAKQVAGTLLVVRRNVTPSRRAKHALAQLRQEGANVLGFVLNCIDPDSSEFSYNQSTR